MKRVAASILLLAAALLISKLFAAELNDFTGQARLISHTPSQNYVAELKQFNDNTLSSAGCPCDTPHNNPTVTLVLIAAIAASLAMAMFIYGSQFIATLVAG
jgi:hypothetical protein